MSKIKKWNHLKLDNIMWWMSTVWSKFVHVCPLIVLKNELNIELKFSFVCVQCDVFLCVLSELIIKIIKQTGDGRLINRNYSYKSIGEGPRRADRENALFGARLRACDQAAAAAGGK